jgi:hypothetical protein
VITDPFWWVLERAPSGSRGEGSGDYLLAFVFLIGCKVGFLRVFALYVCLGIVLTPFLTDAQ